MALGPVGGLLGYATLTVERQKHERGGAMQTILAQPFGKFLLTAAALGFVAFGAFAILQAQTPRVPRRCGRRLARVRRRETTCPPTSAAP